MDLVICASLKLITVQLGTKTMEEKLRCVFYSLILVIQATKTTDLGIYVFQKLITVQQDTRMMEDKQFLAFN